MHHESEWGPRPERECGDEVHILGKKVKPVWPFLDGLIAIFYNKVIEQPYYKSELCLKYQQRFLRYREPLFTFLACDGIPWHNNTAESAIRHLPLQERISGVFHTSVIREYLILLGIRQTCRFQEKSFLKFLLSGEQDVDTFKGSSKNTTIRFPDELTPLWKKTAETP